MVDNDLEVIRGSNAETDEWFSEIYIENRIVLTITGNRDDATVWIGKKRIPLSKFDEALARARNWVVEGE